MANKYLTLELKELEELETLLQEKLNKLAEFELTYSTLKTQLALFENEYYYRVLFKYVEIDKLQAEIDQFYSSQNPNDNELKSKAYESAKKAYNSSKESEEYTSIGIKEEHKFQPTPELKNLYRELVKKFHPDLTTDEKEKERRHNLMLQVNEAYANGDIQKLKHILDNNKNNNAFFDNNTSKIQQLKDKIASIDKKIFELKNLLNDLRKSDLYQLYIKVENNIKNGVDIISQLENSLKGRIEFLTEQLTRLKGQH